MHGMTEWDSARIKAIWNRLADAWDRNRDLIWSFTRPISEHLVERLDPKPGETILEVGCGTGQTGFLVAELLGPDGRLIATDFSTEMIDRASGAAKRLGITNIEFATMDVAALELPAGSVDGVVGRLVYHLVPDPTAALAEARRVLRPGGRLCYTVFGPAEEVPFDLAVGSTISELGLSMPPGITIDIALDNVGVIGEVTARAGFGSVDVEEVRFTIRFPDGGEAWRYLTELYGRAADLIVGLSEDQRAAFRETFLDKLAPYAIGDGYTIPSMVLNVHARP
jgi:ubiquinone/menaquinone biosynthesis C-methylase UbiE